MMINLDQKTFLKKKGGANEITNALELSCDSK